MTSYQIVLTSFVFVGAIGCVPPEPPPTPVVTVPVASSLAVSASATAEDRLSRPPRRLWTWETDLRAAQARAKREQLPLVIYVRADWSAGALGMDREVWSDARIMFHPLALVPLRLDATDSSDAEFWVEELHVQSIPSTIFIDAEGHEAKRIEGVGSVDDVLSALRRLREDTSDR